MRGQVGSAISLKAKGINNMKANRRQEHLSKWGLALILGGSIAVVNGFVAGPARATGLCKNPLCRSEFTGVPRRALLSQLEFKPAVDVYAKFPKDVHSKHSDMPELLQPMSVKLSVTGAAPNCEWKSVSPQHSIWMSRFF